MESNKGSSSPSDARRFPSFGTGAAATSAPAVETGTPSAPAKPAERRSFPSLTPGLSPSPSPQATAKPAERRSFPSLSVSAAKAPAADIGTAAPDSPPKTVAKGRSFPSLNAASTPAATPTTPVVEEPAKRAAPAERRSFPSLGASPVTATAPAPAPAEASDKKAARPSPVAKAVPVVKTATRRSFPSLGEPKREALEPMAESTPAATQIPAPPPVQTPPAAVFASLPPLSAAPSAGGLLSSDQVSAHLASLRTLRDAYREIIATLEHGIEAAEAAQGISQDDADADVEEEPEAIDVAEAVEVRPVARGAATSRVSAPVTMTAERPLTTVRRMTRVDEKAARRHSVTRLEAAFASTLDAFEALTVAPSEAAEIAAIDSLDMLQRVFARFDLELGGADFLPHPTEKSASQGTADDHDLDNFDDADPPQPGYYSRPVEERFRGMPTASRRDRGEPAGKQVYVLEP